MRGTYGLSRVTTFLGSENKLFSSCFEMIFPVITSAVTYAVWYTTEVLTTSWFTR